MKKIVSVLLALVIVFCGNMAVYAETNPKYSDVANELKTYNDKENGIDYKTVEKGKKATLDGVFYYSEGSNQNPTDVSDLFSNVLYMRPEIVLEKNNKKTNIKLQIKGYCIWVDYHRRTDISIEKLNIYSDNGDLTLYPDYNDLSHQKEEDGMYTHLNDFALSVSSNDDWNAEKINKLIKALRTGSFEFQLIFKNDWVLHAQNFDKKMRENWNTIVKAYKEIKHLF